MKGIFQSVFFLLFAGVMSWGVKAQVTIGSTTDPHPGAILDLSQSNNLGLLLPQVSLDDIGEWTHSGGQVLGGDKQQARGMLIFNTNECIAGGDGQGIYVWDGAAWLSLGMTQQPYAEPEMVYVEGGQTTLNGTKVTLSSFYIGKYEVTQKLWLDVMGGWPNRVPSGGDNFPARWLSWDNIVGATGCTAYSINGIDYKTDGFCYRLSKKVGGGKKYRLPTEAEWEYAAKGGQKTNNYTYSGSNNVGDVAWIRPNSGDQIHEVGTKAANELGIYDMSGNAFEWCSDYPSSIYPTGTNNPIGATSGTARIQRSGSFANTEQYAEVTYRSSYPQSNSSGASGFRLVLVP
jgi:formylglycine-generating enzyme required for sulfatase activity